MTAHASHEITLSMMRQSLYAAVVSDALDSLGLRHQSPRVPLRPMTIDKLLNTMQFEIGSRTEVRHALHAYRTGRADFADYLIAELAKSEGCDVTATFDRRLRENPAFQVL